MSTFGRNQARGRLEDRRFVTGAGRYVDDIAPDGALHAYVFRAPVAHADITGLDVSAARVMPGVHMVLTAQDLSDAGLQAGMDASIITNSDGSKGAAPERPLLARGRVRFVGEAVALVVAESLTQARLAAEEILFEYDDLPAHIENRPGGEQIHPEAPENVAFDWDLGDAAACDKALEGAAHRVTLTADDNRVIVNSIEPRGCFAEMEDGRLHVCVNGQGVWDLKSDLAKMFYLSADDVRVTNPDVGGGFGMKAMSYPEYFLVAHVARVLGRPVRWMSDRTEAMLSDNAGRDLVTRAEIGFDADYRITAYKIDVTSNLGAYNSGFAQYIQSDLFARVVTGPYDIPALHLRTVGIYTNSTQIDAYRGAGRPEAIYALERIMDRAARELGIDPWDLRRRNFIPSAAFPYKTPQGETYDVGDFARVLDKSDEQADVAGFAARRAASEAAGKLRGIGLCYYVESILGSPTESSAIEFNADGTVSLYVGTQSNGQGHETVYTRFLSERTGIPEEDIRIVQGDSDRIATGGGTGGSRSVTVQSAATLVTVQSMIAAFTPFLAEALGVDHDDLRFEDGQFRAETSNQHPTLQEAAEMARVAGRTDLLQHRETNTLDGRSFPNGAHVAEVEIDPETGQVSVERYTVTDDFGVLINPQLVAGQVHGGVAQGLGQALLEHAVFDDSGQLLTGSFMDYAMPRAADMPMISFDTQPVPSTTNPLGMKGCGEAGTVGALAALANAVQDAVWDRGITQVDMPFTPNRVWNMLQET